MRRIDLSRRLCGMYRSGLVCGGRCSGSLVGYKVWSRFMEIEFGIEKSRIYEFIWKFYKGIKIEFFLVIYLLNYFYKIVE